MRASIWRLGIFAAAVFFLLAPSRASGQPSPCDRACLERALNGYLDALVAREPARLRLAPSATFTENGQRLALGDGLWRTVTGRVFRIEKGLIVAVESVLHPVPYGMGSGWSTWDEAMSSLPRLR